MDHLLSFKEFLTEQPYRNARGQYSRTPLGLKDTMPPRPVDQPLEFKPTKGIKPVQQKNQPKPRPKKVSGPDATWQNLLNNASKNSTLRSELNVLLLAMYQTRRRNPAIVMSEPKMITGMKNPEIKQQMQQLFNLAKNEDLPHLAARSNQLRQTADSEVNIQGTTKTDNTLIQQLLPLIKKVTPETLEKFKDAIEQQLKARKPEPELPPKSNEKKAVIGMA
jgi:hypothetical protein